MAEETVRKSSNWSDSLSLVCLSTVTKSDGAYVFSKCLSIVYDTNKPLRKKNVSTEIIADIMYML